MTNERKMIRAKGVSFNSSSPLKNGFRPDLTQQWFARCPP
jgi:hypothetical protein